MSTPPSTSYDQLPYVSITFPQTHPDRLAVIARLFGLSPPAPSRCRVLELGCASGGNLIPMAAGLPNSKFVGIDLSGRQIADGQAMVARAGIENIDLRQMDLAQFDPALGQFDYIVAHGVYSWIPREIRERLLAILQDHLAPNGVAHVSYNTYPGWRMREALRDVMTYHTREMADAGMKVRQARALLDFLAAHVPIDNNPYGMFVRDQVEELRKVHDAYLLHEYLEDVNEPHYFHVFVERAQAHGLQYLGDAEFASMLASNVAPDVARMLRQFAPGIIEQEQYLDFLRNRTFRNTLLVHRSATLRRNLDWRNISGLLVASPLRPASPVPDLHSAKDEQFRLANGRTMVASDPIVKAAMTVAAARWPQAIPLTELCLLARVRLAGGTVAPDPGDAERVCSEILRCYAAGLLELRVEPLPVAAAISECPVASSIARLQALDGTRVSNLRHESIVLDGLTRQLIQRLDGTHDKADLMEVAVGLVRDGVLGFRDRGLPIHDPKVIRGMLAQAIPDCLERLHRLALLAS